MPHPIGQGSSRLLQRLRLPKPSRHPIQRRQPSWRQHRLWLLALLLLAALLAIIAVTPYVDHATRPYRYSDPAQVPATRVALVLGAGVVNGYPTPALAERVRGAAELYRLGRVQKLLMSGDNSSQYYNEVEVMRRYAMQLGVPAQDITLDYAGFSTYESAYRARDIFGLRQVVVVTQGYHLPRAVYTCRALGIEAWGLATGDPFSPRERNYHNLRERLATLKALWDLHVSRRQPTFLGPFEGID